MAMNYINYINGTATSVTGGHMLSTMQASELLQCTDSHVTHLIRTGRIQAVKVEDPTMGARGYRYNITTPHADLIQLAGTIRHRRSPRNHQAVPLTELTQVIAAKDFWAPSDLAKMLKRNIATISSWLRRQGFSVLVTSRGPLVKSADALACVKHYAMPASANVVTPTVLPTSDVLVRLERIERKLDALITQWS